MLFLLVNFNTDIFFINERTFLPAFFYILLIGIFPQVQILNPVLPASVFLMLAMKRIIDSYRIPDTAYNFFDAGILISIGTLFYADLIWFSILVIVGIILLRSGNLKEIIISLLGLAAPFIITGGLFYLLGKDIWLFMADIRDNILQKADTVQFTMLTIIILICIALTVLISTGFLANRMNSMKIRSRKTFYLLLWSLLICVALFVFVRSVSVETVWITGIPACYLLTHYFIFEKKKIFSEIVFTLFFLLVLLVQILYVFLPHH
jgi:hypothetical protein